MELRESSRTTPTYRQLLLWTLGYTLVAFALLSTQHDASAANLVDVRVGEHGGYTRVVLELDSLAAYQVSEPREGKDAVMRVALDARGGSRELSVSDAIVSRIRIEADGNSTAILVHLEKAAVQINEMILLSPPRLVFDIRDPSHASVAPAKPAVRKVAKASGAGLAPAKRTPAKPVAKIEPAPKAVAEPVAALVPAPVADAPIKRHKVVGAARSEANETELVKLPGIVPAESHSEDPRRPGTGEVPTAASAMAPNSLATPGSVLSANEALRAAQARQATPGAVAHLPGASLPVGAANSGRPNSLAMPPVPMAASKGDASERLAVPPLPSQRKGATAPSPAAAAEVGILAKARAFVGGLNKMILAGAGLLVILGLFFMIRRGRIGDDALSPVMSADDLGGDGDDLFAQPAADSSSDDSAPMEATEPIPVQRSNASSAPANRESGSGGLEGRVEQLEGALAQLTQSRENMERQLAAQTEELRVQRAAIARTQRVVRSIGEGEEEQGATEPVPRAPAG